MQRTNPMNVSNLLNSPSKAVVSEETSTSSSRRSSHNPYETSASHFSPVNYRSAEQHGPNAPPSPPASDYSPGPRHQLLVLPEPSPSYIPPVTGLPRCELAIRSSYQQHPTLPSPLDPYGQHSQRQSLPSFNHFDSDISSRQSMEHGNFQYSIDHEFRSDYRRSPASPVYSHHSRSRAGSYACNSMRSPSIVSRVSRTSGISKPCSISKPKAKKSSPSNVKYTIEQVDFCRYFKEDMQKQWNDVVVLFKQQFPHEKRESNQCLTSRFYRDNDLPAIDENWQFICEGMERSGHSAAGRKVQRQPAKVRDRASSQHKDAPHKLVEKHPLRALSYPWVAAEHKERAQRILEVDRRDEMMGCLSNAGKWRKVILQADEYSNKEASR